MKINKLVITIFFSAVGLFVSTALQAQEAKTLFVNMPDPAYSQTTFWPLVPEEQSKQKVRQQRRI